MDLHALDSALFSFSTSYNIYYAYECIDLEGRTVHAPRVPGPHGRLQLCTVYHA